MRMSVLTEAGQLHLDVAAGVSATEVAAEVAERSGLGGPVRLHRVTGEALDPDRGLTTQAEPGALLVLRGEAAHPPGAAAWPWGWEPEWSVGIGRQATLVAAGAVGCAAVIAGADAGAFPVRLVAAALLVAALAMAGALVLRPPGALGWASANLAAIWAGGGVALIADGGSADAGSLVTLVAIALLVVGGQDGWGLLPLAALSLAVGVAEWCAHAMALEQAAGLGLVVAVGGTMLTGSRPYGLGALEGSGSPASSTGLALRVAELRRRHAWALAAWGVVGALSGWALTVLLPWGVVPAGLAAVAWWELGAGTHLAHIRLAVRAPAVALGAGSAGLALWGWPWSRPWVGSLVIVGVLVAALAQPPSRESSPVPVGHRRGRWAASLAASALAPAAALCLTPLPSEWTALVAGAVGW